MPLVLAPLLTTAIWGGDALVHRYGKAGDPAAQLGEAWECWDRNAIVNGPLAGKTLAQARALLGHGLTGPPDPAQIFPVLTKIIDARAPLSVQVHPDDAYAQTVEHQPFGKTECWYILAADPGAELVLGWTRGTDRAEVERRVGDGSLAEILRRVPVAPGDAFYLPAGTVHAIGAGIQLFEVQQASDLTYRLFDWNRTGADGKPRELHVAKALDVLDYRATFPVAQRVAPLVQDGCERTIAIVDRRFTLERCRALAAGATFTTHGRALAITAMETGLEIATAGAPLTLRAWETAVVPACAPRMTFVRPGEALIAQVEPNLSAVSPRE
jgi:mannose-6-phosphate isomerase